MASWIKRRTKLPTAKTDSIVTRLDRFALFVCVAREINRFFGVLIEVESLDVRPRSLYVLLE